MPVTAADQPPDEMVEKAATPGLIRQQHDYGCGIASLAMISERTYDEVRAWLLANWPPGEPQVDGDWLEKRGIHKHVTDWFLAQHGYAWRTFYSYGGKVATWPPEPFAPVHLVMVRQPSGNSHYAVMRADGVVLDPLSDEPRRLTDWEQIDNVQGVWDMQRMVRDAKAEVLDEAITRVGQECGYDCATKMLDTLRREVQS